MNSNHHEQTLLEVFMPFGSAITGGGSLAPINLRISLYNRFKAESEELFASEEAYNKIITYFKSTVIPHKIEVWKAHSDILELFPEIQTTELRRLLFIHDLSKFSVNECIAYCNHNFKSKEPDQAFERAWHHHKMNNPHHSEYWLNPGKSGKVEPLEMPPVYVAEMFCDWIGAGRTYGSTLEEWAPKNVGRFLFHPKTKELVYDVLGRLGISV